MERLAAFFRGLRPKKLPPPVRTIKINDPVWQESASFLSNKIMTAKYSVWTFIPKFLFEQFLRLANFYFLVISLIQISSVNLAPTGQWYTFGPLMGILALTAIKELVEDIKRHQQDQKTNVSKAIVLGASNFGEKLWRDVRVGDIVMVESEKHFPADLLLLASSEPEALCYVETANLDGETNLKILQGVHHTSKMQTPEEILAFQGEFSCEGPNNRLHNFEGTLKFGTESVPVGPNQVLLRGSRLKNTRWIYGLVIYTGHDSKLLMNSSATPIKKSRLERTANNQILAIFGLLFLMALACTIGFIIWNQSMASMNAWYLEASPQASTSLSNFTQFIVFIILFNTVVPISLYVSIEIVKFCQAIFINNDVEMYYEEGDTPATAKTSNLNEELGQVDFIFSDKTGTLTRNQMEFRKCSVAGVKYGLGYTDAARGAAKRQGKTLPPDQAVESDDPYWNFYDPSLLDNLTQDHATASFLREFLTLLAVCHTVIPERDKENQNKIVYQAASPDEAALVSAAKHLGFYFNTRKPTCVRIMALSSKEEYEILNVLEFSSSRKRMSVICRTPHGKLKLLCKGADSVIFERLAPKQKFLEKTTEHLEEFALEGLRTLCISVAELDPAYYEEWKKKYHEASTTLVNRTEALEAAYEEIERNLFLLGATGIEDKLQDGVPDTIAELMKAGIRIWMLTGDKKETAINIGYACQLLKEKAEILTCDAESVEEIQTWVTNKLADIKEDKKNLALVIDGKTLTFALESKCKNDIVKLAIMCEACICCRVSPSQKAKMVTLVKQNLKCITLAIGDGANDVSMIQAADVGIGITGHEGLQAARSSDYSIGQFKFLKRLLLVHGHLSYRRLSKVILYSFYKTLTLYLVSFYFSFLNGFSGQLPWDRLTNTLWNIIFTSLGVIILGIFEQDIPQDFLMKHPEVYMAGQRNDFFNLRVFFGWFFNSIYHSLLVFILVEVFFYNETTFPGTGDDQDIYALGTVLFICVLLTVTGKIALVTRYWTVWNHVTYFGGLLLYFLVFMGCGFVFITFYGDAQALFGEAPRLLKSGQFYFTIFIIPITCLLKDYAWAYFRRTVMPEDYHVIQERALLCGSPKDVELEGAPDHPPALSMDARRRSGFAFSQAEFADDKSKDAVSQLDLIRKYDTTTDKPEGK